MQAKQCGQHDLSTFTQIFYPLWNAMLINTTVQDPSTSLDALTVLSGGGMGVAADYAEYARRISDLH